MKKIIKIIISIVLIFVVSFVCYICFDVNSYLGVRLYPGSRITVNLYVTVDGESVNVTKDDNTYFLIDNGDYSTIKDRANDYDTYTYNMYINDIPFYVTVRHWNWWEILKCDLYIDIDTQSNSYTTYQTYTITEESDICGTNYHTESYDTEKETYNDLDCINVSAGYLG
jgi:hypothetical protein